ncbi:hypothetical protein V4F39_02420 [Aquincola sp. MAHUQ-54]|uniref:Uncharacterized protein n=1 Tax=Aquincola agrisoli TaxID=3119538 RepID=A0AAW9PYB5_9BURK
MTCSLNRLAGAAMLWLAAAAAPCHADSLASSALSAGSASVGSVSDSISGSSNSSSRNDRVAEGDYRIVEVAAAGRPGGLRLTLQPADPRPGAEDFVLDLPARTGGTWALAQGDLITARHRPYGLEFARADTREAFFLALADDWFRELAPKAVPL